MQIVAAFVARHKNACLAKLRSRAGFRCNTSYNCIFNLLLECVIVMFYTMLCPFVADDLGSCKHMKNAIRESRVKLTSA